MHARPTRSRSLLAAGASLALHVAVGAALVLSPRPASPSGELAFPALEVVRVPTWVPVEPVLDEEFPDEPEGGATAAQASATVPGDDARPRHRPGRGRGRATGDAQGSGPPTDASVTLGEPEVFHLDLGIPRAEIFRTLRGRAHEVRQCTPRGSDDFARVVVGFTVGPDGTVADSRIASSTHPDPAVGECMVAAISRWTFPPAPNGGSTRVTYPFVVGPFDAQ